MQKYRKILYIQYEYTEKFCIFCLFNGVRFVLLICVDMDIYTAEEKDRVLNAIVSVDYISIDDKRVCQFVSALFALLSAILGMS